MTADCIDTAHNFPNINTFVLVSGDSDFIHVINSLRAVGKRVLGGRRFLGPRRAAWPTTWTA